MHSSTFLFEAEETASGTRKENYSGISQLKLSFPDISLEEQTNKTP
jgi:hypothetical protein